MEYLRNIYYGVRLGINSYLGTYNSVKIFKQIVVENLKTLFFTNVLFLAKSYIPLWIYYPILLKVTINSVIFNGINTLSLLKAIRLHYQYKKMGVFSENKPHTLLESFSLIFYYKVHYVIDLTLLYILSSSILYYVYLTYFYGRYIVEVYLSLRNVSEATKEGYIRRLTVYMAGIGFTFMIMNELSCFILCKIFGEYDFIASFVVKDVIFTAIYSMFIIRFEQKEHFPTLENPRPYLLNIDKSICDYIFGWIIYIIKRGIKDRFNGKPNCKLSIILFKFLPYNILESKIIRQYVDLHKEEILDILDTIIKCKNSTRCINDTILKLLLSPWLHKDLIKLGIFFLNIFDLETLVRYRCNVSEIESDFIVLISPKTPNDESIIVIDKFEDCIYSSEISKKFQSKSPTVSNINLFELEENHFKT